VCSGNKGDNSDVDEKEDDGPVVVEFLPNTLREDSFQCRPDPSMFDNWEQSGPLGQGAFWSMAPDPTDEDPGPGPRLERQRMVELQKQFGTVMNPDARAVGCACCNQMVLPGADFEIVDIGDRMLHRLAVDSNVLRLHERVVEKDPTWLRTYHVVFPPKDTDSPPMHLHYKNLHGRSVPLCLACHTSLKNFKIIEPPRYSLKRCNFGWIPEHFPELNLATQAVFCYGTVTAKWIKATLNNKTGVVTPAKLSGHVVVVPHDGADVAARVIGEKRCTALPRLTLEPDTIVIIFVGSRQKYDAATAAC
jgi:hypothetical protein